MPSRVADAPLAIGALRTPRCARPAAPVPGVGSRCYAPGVFLDPPDVASTSAPSPGVDELAARIWRGSDLVIAIGLVLLAIVIVSAAVAALYAAGVIADRGELFDTPVLLITIAFELSLGLIVIGLAVLAHGGFALSGQGFTPFYPFIQDDFDLSRTQVGFITATIFAAAPSDARTRNGRCIRVRGV